MGANHAPFTHITACRLRLDHDPDLDTFWTLTDCCTATASHVQDTTVRGNHVTRCNGCGSIVAARYGHEVGRGRLEELLDVHGCPVPDSCVHEVLWAFDRETPHTH